jgi:regulatory protein
MPKITAIQSQKRRQDRYSIFIDGRYVLSLSADQVAEMKLQLNQSLDADQIQTLEQQSEFGKALDRVYNFLSYRFRSQREVSDYLRRKGYDDDLAQRITQQLKESEFLNDRRFAEQWARDRTDFGLRSRRVVALELRQKGIAPDIIAEVLEGIPDSDEISQITALIEARKLRQRYPDERKLITHLTGKGFSFNNIKAALEQLLES